MAARYGSGRPVTPILDATYDAASATWVPRYGTAYSERLPSFHRIDGSLNRIFFLPDNRFVVAFLAVNNLFDRKNINDYRYSRTTAHARPCAASSTAPFTSPPPSSSEVRMRRLARSCFALLVLLLFTPIVVQAQNRDARVWADSIRRAIETAYLSAAPDSVVHARALAERALTRFPADSWLLHYLGYALYREAVLRMEQEGGDVGPLLEQAQAALEQSAARLDVSETHALLSSVMGQRSSGLSPVTMLFAQLEQHHRRRPVPLHVDDAFRRHRQQRKPRIVRDAVAHVIDLAEVHPSVRPVQLTDQRTRSSSIRLLSATAQLPLG